MPDEKSWNLPLISSLFEPSSVLKIVKTPLYNSGTRPRMVVRTSEKRCNGDGGRSIARMNIEWRRMIKLRFRWCNAGWHCRRRKRLWQRKKDLEGS
ncbi:hypothetical protein QL285_096560 [Trifolium repens]|nr:hypothetical protein QL285_096560 [Trifolium repens]